MRLRCSRGLISGCGILFCTVLAVAQQGGLGGAAGGNRRECSSNTPGGGCSPQDSRRLVTLTGRVVVGDGSPPPEPVSIERVCYGNARAEGTTDSKGQFRIDLGRSTAFQDASVGGDTFSSSAAQDPFQGGIGTNQSFVSERDLWNCEIRAALSGYRSDVIFLSQRRVLDRPDIGTIVIRRISGNSEGQMLSATSAMAPKDARKAFSKAIEDLKRRKTAEAEAGFEKAVAVYPKYATAWMELGKLHEQHSQDDDARKAFRQAVAADPKFIPPYEHLSALAFRASQWQDLADVTGQILKLDPSTAVEAYYFSSVANFQLKHYDVSEKHATEAVKLDPLKRNRNAYYVLGLSQASQDKFVAAAETLKLVLASPPLGVDLEVIRNQLADVEAAAKEAVSRPSVPQ